MYEIGNDMNATVEGIACWQRIDARLTTSGALTEANLALLSTLGIDHVINLALADSPGILLDEEERLAARGIAYTHIPVPFNAPDAAHLARFCAVMDASDQQAVHVHCVRNWRVSAFLYRWHRERRGMPEREARALLQQQWEPETNDHEDARTWARFIAGDAN